MEAAEFGQPYGYECAKFRLIVSNYNGATPLSPILHRVPSESILKFIPNYSRNNLRDAAALEARSALSILLYELQEGLVVKLLLPTEPTTPAPPVSISASRRSSMSDNRSVTLAVTPHQDCWQ